jgi:hypothetical protein
MASQFIGETASDGSRITVAVPVPNTETNGGGNTAEQINATFSDGTHYRLVIVLHNGEKLFKSLYQQ